MTSEGLEKNWEGVEAFIEFRIQKRFWIWGFRIWGRFRVSGFEGLGVRGSLWGFAGVFKGSVVDF